jgi:RNA polymerase sigma-70 factor (ECF subfamily)
MRSEQLATGGNTTLSSASGAKEPLRLLGHAADPAGGTDNVQFEHAHFAAAYQAYIERIYAFVFSHVGNREDAEDVTSQVFIKAYKSLPTFQARGSFEGWLFQIARTAMADFWRERYKLHSIPLTDRWEVPEGHADQEFDDAARRERVNRLLSCLPENYRQVLEQRFLLRSSIAETARALAITEANVRVLQFRALRRAAELARDGAW